MHVFSHYPMPMCNRSPSRQTAHLDPGRDSRKGCKLNSIDYVSKVRQQKIGTSPDIMSLKKQKTKIQKRIFYQLESEGSNGSNEPGTSTLVQLRRIRTGGRDFEVPTHSHIPLLTRGQGIKNLPQIEETMWIDTWRTQVVESWKKRREKTKTT